MSTMPTIDETITAVLGDGGDGQRHVTLPPAFQGLPGMAHGGTVLALFDAIAGDPSARRLAGHYIRRVPLGAPLRLSVTRVSRDVTCRVLDASGTVLVDGSVTAPPTHGARDAPLAARETNGVRPLPISTTCFVCGVENPLGLHARLGFDESHVRGTWVPRAPFERKDGRVATAAVTALLDEAAFWLGALATGESGMTTELEVSVLRLPSFAERLTVLGERARVTPKPEDARYLTTDLCVFDEAGRTIAAARITFVAVRGAARRLVTGMLAMNPADVVRPVFPSYLP